MAFDLILALAWYDKIKALRIVFHHRTHFGVKLRKLRIIIEKTVQNFLEHWVELIGGFIHFLLDVIEIQGILQIELLPCGRGLVDGVLRAYLRGGRRAAGCIDNARCVRSVIRANPLMLDADYPIGWVEVAAILSGDNTASYQIVA